MYYYKPTNQVFKHRKEIKAYLGGTNALNRAMKNKQIIIIFAELQNIADNGTIHYYKQTDFRTKGQ